MKLSWSSVHSPASAAPTDLGLNPDGSAINPIALIRHLRGDPNIMRQLQEVIACHQNLLLFHSFSFNTVEFRCFIRAKTA